MLLVDRQLSLQMNNLYSNLSGNSSDLCIHYILQYFDYATDLPSQPVIASENGAS